ncbi:MAG TPA: FAD-binding oxidoreductase [Candidatus Limnocylindria bacterium]|jgi:FAD/FMN-containing dehydrogenase|nr:FAD-binding oxidoreductase [Candidatus Limnocylindria bacterium]
MTETTYANASTLEPDALRGTIRGTVIGADDEGYDAARQVAPGGIDRHPALIVQVADAGDVATVIGLARETGLELAVRSGGHSNAGHGVTEGGIVIDLRGMKDLRIDPDSRTAWAETGLTTLEVTAATAEHGLVVGFGDTGTVGIGGITLGGGVGYLARKHGLTIDSLLAAELVTADGELLMVDDDHHADLFWAIRGGGGNFGVATRFKYQLHPLGGFVGGFLFLPATVDTLTGAMAAAEAAPEELSGIVNVMPLPPMPMLPEEVHGRLGMMVILAHVGDEDAGQRAMKPFRDLAEPYADLVRPMSYPEIYPPADDSYHPLAVARTMFLDRFDRDVAESVVQHLEASDAPMRAAQLRVLGGAMARVPSDATAFAHRASRIMVNLAAFYDGPQNFAQREAWVLGFMRDIQQQDQGAYVNFLVDEPERIRDAYPGTTYDRLARIKARYDPTNLFRLNHNIPPAV